MSPVRSVVASVVATFLTVSLTTTALHRQPEPRAEGVHQLTAASLEPVASRTQQRGRLRIMPQIAQPGRKRMSPRRAKSVLLATFRPARKGRKVVLQRRQDGRWLSTDTARQNGRGHALFTARFKRRGQHVTYRAFTVRHGDLPRKNTRPKSTDNRWRSPELDSRFSGSSMPAEWAHRQTDYTGYRKCAISSPRALRIGNGRLRLSVKNDPTRPSVSKPKAKCETKYGNFDWRITGHASTEGRYAFQYGFAAARIRFQRRAGQHGGFWLQPASGDATGTEIDVIEWFGDRRNNDTELSSFVHRDGVKDRTCGLINDPARYGHDWWERYHVFSVEWTRKRYVFRIDGRETCRTGRFVSHTPEFLVLSIQANTYEIPLLDGDPAAPHSSRRLPQHVHVDWARTWER